MSEIVIQVNHLGKQYRLGQVGTGTISHDLNRWWHRIRGVDDPYLKVGEINNRSSKGNSDLVWALKDISFEVEKGDVLGIIGKNGAGKSTLLKILSQVTSPTTGEIKVKGRIASLLEVGTGFHPELTGRENIFLNGAILGMTKKEIKSKFDEIVDFSGVERYIDTPVKRYSSGMYVRLAFAVAAHLEPEILIVDEVLAVGDAEFQKKCLGKMKDVSGQGRTVLFVSHNISAIQNLCNKSLLLIDGTFKEIGLTNKVVNTYLSINNKKGLNEFCFTKVNDIAFAEKLELKDLNANPMLEIPLGKEWRVDVTFTVIKEANDFVIGLGLVNNYETPIRTSWNKVGKIKPGKYRAIFIEKSINLSCGEYKLLIGISLGRQVIQYLDEDVYFTISDVVEKQNENVINSGNGIIINQMEMYVEKID